MPVRVRSSIARPALKHELRVRSSIREEGPEFRGDSRTRGAARLSTAAARPAQRDRAACGQGAPQCPMFDREVRRRMHTVDNCTAFLPGVATPAPDTLIMIGTRGIGR